MSDAHDPLQADLPAKTYDRGDDQVSPRNPILREIRSQGFFDKPPQPKAGTVFVVEPKRGKPFVVPSEDHPRLKSGKFRSANRICEVDVGRDSFEFTDYVASAQDDFRFEASVQVTYTIDDPVKIIQSGIRDTRSDVRQLILSAIVRKSRRFDVASVTQAQHSVEDEVEGDDGIAARRLTQHGYTMLDSSIALKRERDITDITREQATIEIKKDFYGGHTGSVRQLMTLLLAEGKDPQALEKALNIQIVSEREKLQAQLTLAQSLLASGALEDHEAQQIAQHILPRLQQRLNDELPANEVSADIFPQLPSGTPQTPQLKDADAGEKTGDTEST
jgi:hypothetical protein